MVVLAVVSVMTTGCAMFGKVAVRAVARGVPSAAPFFKQALALGADVAVGSALSRRGGEKRGGDAGLYGGTRNPLQCDRDKLVEFLRKPENRKKAEQWAEIKGLGGVDEIAGYVEKLTPVLLRGDTLVKNHDYKKGKAIPFDALLEAGIAVLVDQFGEPAVQCSCGNPLSAFGHDIADADVEFDGDNKKWESYDAKKVAKVKPAPKTAEVEKYELVNVEKPSTGLAREAGSDGSEDEVLPEAPVEEPGEETVADPSDLTSAPSTGEPTPDDVTAAEVPEVTGQLAEDARQFLEDQGFQVVILAESTGTAPPGTIIRQTPEPHAPPPADGMITLIMEEVPTEPTEPPTGPIDPPTAPPVTGGSTGETDGTGEEGGTGQDGGTDTGTFGFGGT
ncbi:PASTA domain-containing protein [Streptomyces tailanensis]|uniref:PASTA domain-containing protein n=1 Tax=Streptomyces tailanensis TaxID=2569858 RepID=UPI001FE78B24|nr:PASTA domain-containing protein [Streptomyces tailanensis]